MNSDTYVELLIKKKASAGMVVLKFVMIALTVLLMLAALLGIGSFVSLIAAIVFAVGAYLIYLNADVEYEYLYVDKELSVDKVMAKSKRKKVDTFDLVRMEILAPLNSHRLDSYKNRQVKTVDYSSSVAGQPEVRYAMYYDGSKKVILEPNQALIKAIQNIAPRKVFTD